MIKRGHFIFIFVIALLMLFSCSSDTDTEESSENKSFTVSFDTLGGSSVKPIEAGYGENIRKPYATPAKMGYIFESWYYGDREWDFDNDKVLSNITLTAKYRTLDFSITYETFGGVSEEPLPEIYNIESGVITLPTLTLGDSVFDGWYLSGEKITEISFELRKDITLVAKFYDEIPEILKSSISSSETSVYATKGENRLSIELTTKAEKESSMTLRVSVPESWYYVRASQNNNIRYLKTEKIGEKNTVSFEMISDSFDLVISPVTLSDGLTLESDFGTTLANGHKIDTNYFPGFVRKTVSFTLDDGLIYDETLLNILRPAGIRGTFNICNVNRISAEEYRALYEGYEIANHHILHTTLWREGFDYSSVVFSDEFLPSSDADRDPSVIYKNGTKVDGKLVDGFYYVHYSVYGSTAGWHPLATNETYMEYLLLTEKKIEEVFGEGSVAGFAYPHGTVSETVKELIKSEGYLYARKTGNLKDSTGFSLPTDRFAWTYNADHNCLLDVMADFDAYKDDGSLKMFSFGVHAKDFETYNKWKDLQEFAELYGNREEDFWYATNREIFEYEDALDSLVITDAKIQNPSSVDLFITVDGIKTLIEAKSEYIFK